MKPLAPVAVTGVGALCGAGRSLDACLAGMFAGVRSPAPPTRFTTDHPAAHPVFEVPDDFLPEDLRDEGLLLRTSRLALAAARQALADAGLDTAGFGADLAGLRVGVCIGTTVGSAMNNEAFYQAVRKGGRPPMDAIRRFLRSNPADAVSRHFGFDGPCQTVVNACSSGTDAVGIGAAWIRAGVCDAVLAGGADELCRVTYDGFISLLIADTEPVRPFDTGRRGLNLGEGAGMLLLESEALRAKRGRRARARVLGYGSASDAHHLTAPCPEGSGLTRAIAEALATAGLGAEDVAFVNAHGTGTPDNDRVESRTLAAVLPGVPFHATKGFTGHTLGAAGGLEAAFTVACLERGEIPASVGCAEPEPGLPAPTLAPTRVRGAVALSQSLAFGGNNAVLALGKGG